MDSEFVGIVVVGVGDATNPNASSLVATVVADDAAAPNATVDDDGADDDGTSIGTIESNDSWYRFDELVSDDATAIGGVVAVIGVVVFAAVSDDAAVAGVTNTKSSSALVGVAATADDVDDVEDDEISAAKPNSLIDGVADVVAGALVVFIVASGGAETNAKSSPRCDMLVVGVPNAKSSPPSVVDGDDVDDDDVASSTIGLTVSSDS